MKTAKQITGTAGESIAVTFLQKAGYTILETNWRFRHWEIDIIAQYQELLVFCEVKTRSSYHFGLPAQFVSRKQQQNLIRAAQQYLIQKRRCNEVRFDIIGILQQGNKYEVTHDAGAFTPRW